MLFTMQNKNGFTLIETLVAIFITGIVSTTLLLSVTQAKLYLASIRLKEQAFIELKNHTNELKSMGAAGISASGINQWSSMYGGTSGRKVTLKESIDGEPLIEGKLYQKYTIPENSGTFSEYYNIETSIVWKNPNNLFSNKSNYDTLTFNTYQIKFQID